MPLLELSIEFEQHRKTYWEFKLKIQQAMQSDLKYPLTGVRVDECFIGREEEQKQGQSKGKKMVIVVLNINV